MFQNILHKFFCHAIYMFFFKFIVFVQGTTEELKQSKWWYPSSSDSIWNLMSKNNDPFTSTNSTRSVQSYSKTGYSSSGNLGNSNSNFGGKYWPF